MISGRTTTRHGATGRRARAALHLIATTAVALLVLGSPVRGELSFFVRGDTNADSTVDIADPVKALEHLFLGGSVDCEDAADSNDDGALDIADPVNTLGFLFLGGDPMPAPGPFDCGIDASEDSLTPCTDRSCPGTEVFTELVPVNLRLVEDNSEEQAAGLQSGRFESALDSVLNSPGDSIDLDVEASVSIAIIALVNGNGKVTYKVAITVADDGAHEVSVDYSQASGLGVEIVDGIEANARAGVATTTVFRFEDLAETVRAIQDMALSLIVEPIRDRIEALFGRAAEFAGKRDEALAELEDALVEESRLADELDSLNGALRAVNNEISDLNGWLQRVNNDLAGLACNLVPSLCNELNATKNAINRELNEARTRRNNIVREITETENQLAAAREAVGRARDRVQAAEAALEEAERVVGEARQVIEALIGAQDRIGASFGGYQFRFLVTGDLQAQLSPFPGVKAGGANFGAAVEAERTIGGRLDFATDSRPEKFTLSRTYKRTYGAQLGVVEGKAFVETTHDVVFAKSDGWFDEVESSVKMTLDAHGELVQGLVFVGKRGIGRNIEIEFPLFQMADQMPEIVRGLLDGDGAPLANALLGVSATITRKDRRTAAAGVDVGASYAGYGGGFKGLANWTDVGDITVNTVDAGLVVGSIAGRTRADELLRAIADRVEAERD